MQTTIRWTIMKVFCALAMVRAFSTALTMKRHHKATSRNRINDSRLWQTGSTVPTENADGASDDDDDSNLNLVLFGIGDLRTDDHLGLYRAVAARPAQPKGITARRRVAALCVLDEACLTNMPGAVSHTQDSAIMILAALDDLSKELKAHYNLPLRVVAPRAGISVASILSEIAKDEKSNCKDGTGSLCVHVHDLGDADNQLGYSPWSQLKKTVDDLPSKVKLETWTSDLRPRPWQEVHKLPSFYTEYKKKYMSDRPMEPMDTTTAVTTRGSSATIDAIELRNSFGSVVGANQILDAETLVEHMTKMLNLDAKRVQAEVNTGLYMTHWGGLQMTTVGCRAALDITQAYLGNEVKSDDGAWTRHPLYPGRACRRNGRSLEHASMQWQLRGKGENTPTGDVKEWLQGESLVRWTAAPLLLGTLSPRRLWHTADKYETSRFFFDDPAKTCVEAREWHRLLAAYNIRTNGMYSEEKQTKTLYKYWRYHGFLCRYAITEMERKMESDEKEGILLVHGFGASGSQWNKVMQAMSTASAFNEGLALDLLGFGESEKPAISYTAYLWDSIVGDFIKDRAIAHHSWDSFVLGGNSIGGFTSMSAAASDCARVREDGVLTVSSSGAMGTNRCKGLVLMNSAGPIYTRDEVQTMLDQSTDYLQRASVAQITALDALPPCSPPPRPVARTFGNTLLTYLRPNIQSICKNLYPTNPGAVDEILCEGILRDSLDPGAINVMMAGAKLPSPRSSNELLGADFRLGQTEKVESSTVHESSFDGPVLIAQGVLDPLNDAKDRMERYGALRDGITTSPIQAGHCPHDELPEEVAQSISRWAVSVAAAKSKVAIAK